MVDEREWTLCVHAVPVITGRAMDLVWERFLWRVSTNVVEILSSDLGTDAWWSMILALALVIEWAVRTFSAGPVEVVCFRLEDDVLRVDAVGVVTEMRCLESSDDERVPDVLSQFVCTHQVEDATPCCNLSVDGVGARKQSYIHRSAWSRLADLCLTGPGFQRPAFHCELGDMAGIEGHPEFLDANPDDEDRIRATPGVAKGWLVANTVVDVGTFWWRLLLARRLFTLFLSKPLCILSLLSTFFPLTRLGAPLALLLALLLLSC